MEKQTSPDRWMHIRQPAGFSPEMFDVFVANSEVFVAHARALLSVWNRLPGNASHPATFYYFYPAELSQDRTIATLPIGGASTVGTRSEIENGCAFMLWRHFPMSFMEGLDEGITETLDLTKGAATSWRAPSHTISFIRADPSFRRRSGI